MRNIDLSSWQSVLSTLLVLALVTLIGVGVRVLMMMTIQQRRQRLNRQINERLRTLIAAYKTLGGSFTGDLTADPTHLRDLHARARAAAAEEAADADDEAAHELSSGPATASDRRRRIRDAVEAALSDIILLGTEEQVHLAQRAANQLVAGHPVHMHELVISLRNFIRLALDLDPIPDDVAIPMQGPRDRRARADAARAKAATAVEVAAAVAWEAVAAAVPRSGPPRWAVRASPTMPPRPAIRAERTSFVAGHVTSAAAHSS